MKRGQSQIITSTLLIILVLAVLVIVVALLFTFFNKTGKEVSRNAFCFSNVDLTVERGCYNKSILIPGNPPATEDVYKWDLYILIKNNKDVIYNQSFFVDVLIDGRTVSIPLPARILESKGQKSYQSFSAENLSLGEEFLLIPVATNENNQIVKCYESAIAFLPDKC